MGENPEITTEVLRDALISEITAEEFRAERSLRVLQHQEGRISSLANELSGKSNMLAELQESHSNLMEVHRYQEEVQALQRQLIKMQEIQYLTEVVQPKMEQNENDNETKGSTISQQYPQTSQKQHQRGDPKNNGKGKLDSAASGTQRSIISFSKSLDKDGKSGSGATDNAILFQKEETRSTNKFGSLKSSLGELGSLIQQQSDSKKEYFTGNGTNGNGDCYYTQDDESGAVLLNDDDDDEDGQKLVTFDDDDEQICILRDTLSSHKQSIEDLSSEVVLLRKERSELLVYVRTLMDWKSKVEHILEDYGIAKSLTGSQNHLSSHSVEESDSKREIDVIMGPPRVKPVSSSYPQAAEEKPVHKTLSSLSLLSVSTTGDESYLDDYKTRVSQRNCRHVGWSKNLNHEDLYNDKDENQNERPPGSCTKLEERAHRMWDTACKYFTPQQAHFILTAPIPKDMEEEETDNESWIAAFAEHTVKSAQKKLISHSS